MARAKKKRRKGIRRRVRGTYARARRAVRRVSRKRRRSAPKVVYRSRPVKRRKRSNRRPGVRGLPKMGISIAAGVGGAVGAAALVNMAPISDNRSKALAAMAAGLGGWLLIPKRNKLLRMASVGATLGGALSLTKQMFPQIPMMAGAEPYTPMGVNMRPAYPRIANRAQRAASYGRQETAMFRNATRGGRNARFMGQAGGNRQSAGAQFGNFLTPANM